jgi:AraC-like DNA-binding protein
MFNPKLGRLARWKYPVQMISSTFCVDPNWLEALDWDLRGADARRLQTRVAPHLKHYRLRHDPPGSRRGRMLQRRLGRTRMLLIECGAAAEVDAGRLSSFSVLQWPLRGRYHFPLDGRGISVTSNRIHLIPPAIPLRLQLSPDCTLLVVRLAAESAAGLGLELAAAPVRSDPRSGAIVDINGPAGQSLARTLVYALTEAAQSGLPPWDDIAAAHCEALLLSRLRACLRELRPPAIGEAASPGTRVVTACVTRAESYLLAHLGSAVRLEDVARASGVAPSTLSQSFSRVHGTGPLNWWRQRRLDHCYEALTSGSNPSVTEVGLAYGFTHLGRFSASYAKRFGESPRQTLQRAAARDIGR